MKRILSLTRYNRQGASSRLRSLQYFPALEAADFEVVHRPLFDDDYLAALYAKAPTRALQARALTRRWQALRSAEAIDVDVIWVEKELFPWLPYGWEKRFLPRNVPLVLDLDDAIFHNYDQHRSPLVRALLGRKIDALMARADLVIGGSPYLCERARKAGATRVEYLPTVVDLARYPLAPVKSSGKVSIGWMGTPVTARFLQPVAPALAMLAERYDLELRVVGGQIELPGVPIVCEPWSEATEAASIGRMDIGIMPLTDSPWERGKCGYKLIQYMAVGRPVVASPVGVNRDLVEEGRNGFCASTPEEWQRALERLIVDPALRVQCGRVARARVEDRYCLAQTAPKLVQWMKELAA